MKYQMFRLEVADYIATVTFDRPPVNAQNRQSREEAIHLFDALSDRDDVRCVILTSGSNAFSAGADVKERVGLVREPGDYVRHNRLTREFFYAITDCAKPVVAAVNGAAFGAGFVLALSCDIVIAAEDAYFVMPELDVGLAGGAGFLMQHFSRSMARYMYFTARRIPAAELHRLGVITAVLPPDRLMAEARAVATEIAAKSPGAVTAVKRAFNVAEAMPTRDAYRYEQTITVDLSKTEDTREAQRAFVEKRKPKFTGK
jgi:enoyl-CoA hydratase/carnithine racemase